MKILASIVAAVVFLAAPAMVSADAAPILAGHVFDIDSGRVVANAEVGAASPEGAAIVRADRTGHFVFMGLPPGRYTISVSKPGYATGLVVGVPVYPGGSYLAHGP